MGGRPPTAQAATAAARHADTPRPVQGRASPWDPIRPPSWPTQALRSAKRTLTLDWAASPARSAGTQLAQMARRRRLWRPFRSSGDEQGSQTIRRPL